MHSLSWNIIASGGLTMRGFDALLRGWSTQSRPIDVGNKSWISIKILGYDDIVTI